VGELLSVRLESFGLKISEEKTHYTDLGNSSGEGLAPRKPASRRKEQKGPKRRRIEFLGFNVLMQKTRSGSGEKVVFHTEKKRFSRAKARIKERMWRSMHLPVEQQAEMICSFLIGHYNYYGLTGNTRRLDTLRWLVIQYWRGSPLTAQPKRESELGEDE
jgi:RNA-directed DNA polymerase